MARYNREFLLPYLNNICALHIAKERILIWYDHAVREGRRIDGSLRIENPKCPEDEYIAESAIGSFFLGLSALLFFCMSCISSDEKDRAPALVLALLSCACVAAIIIMVRKVHQHNARRQGAYQEACIAYDVHCKRLAEKAEQEKKRVANQMAACQREINRIDNLLKQMYGANIIPSMYRNKYAAVYLYDWFGTSGADDLDHALSMYVLEEIKARLDQIIEQQSEMILNQRLMLAKQQESIDAQNRHSDMMRRKLNQLQATEEERLRYERMTEANTAATAYFAAATYLKS